MEQDRPSFSYTYSAKQQEEVKRIRQKYLPPEADKMAQLRALDERATRPGKIAALVAGILGALVLGVGMCCTMVWTDFFILGVIVGIVGLVGVSCAYPLYTLLTRREREKLAPQILELSRELLGS